MTVDTLLAALSDGQVNTKNKMNQLEFIERYLLGGIRISLNKGAVPIPIILPQLKKVYNEGYLLKEFIKESSDLDYLLSDSIKCQVLNIEESDEENENENENEIIFDVYSISPSDVSELSGSTFEKEIQLYELLLLKNEMNQR